MRAAADPASARRTPPSAAAARPGRRRVRRSLPCQHRSPRRRVASAAMAVVEGAGVELAYEERGSGSGVLLVHGLAARGSAWAQAATALAPDARVVTYDRRGYGGSGAPDPYDRTTVEEQAEDAAALVRSLGLGPVVVAGRDVGALVALDLAWRHGDLVRGVVAVDPAALQLSAMATEVLAAERVALE